MISRSWSRKSMAFGLAVAILSIYSMVVLAAPGATGRLAVFGRVTVNGQSADCGDTINSDSTISTSDKASAVVSLGSLGVVELMPNSSIKLSFNDSGFTGILEAGQVKVVAPAGISASIVTRDGSALATSNGENSFTVNLTCGTTMIDTLSGNVELHAGGLTKQIAAGTQDAAGQAAPGQRCTQVRTREVKRLYPRCTRVRK